jgi:hypothetical protein
MRHERVSKNTRQYLEQTHAAELVGEAEEARLLASLGKYPNKSIWQRRRRMGKGGRSVLLSPFGLVEVVKDIGFVVSRNDAPLYHTTCRPGRPSIFFTRAAAQAAARAALGAGLGRLCARARLPAVRLGRLSAPATDHVRAAAGVGRG